MKLNWKKILKHIPEDKRDEIQKIIEKDYLDVVTTNYPVVVGEDGRLRFKASKLIRWLVDNLYNHPTLSLNGLGTAYRHKVFPKKDYMEFYRQMGYSLDGFGEIFATKVSHE